MSVRILLLTLLLILPLPAGALEIDPAITGQVDTSELEEKGERIMGEPLDSVPDLESGLARIGRMALDYLSELAGETAGSGGVILVISLFTGLLQTLGDEISPGIGRAALLAGTLAVTTAAVGDARSVVLAGQETILELNELTKVLMPALTSAAAAAGSLTGAAARQMATLICSNLLLTWMNELLIPMVYCYIAVCAGALAADNPGLQAVGELIGWAVKTMLKWMLLLFTLYLSISGVISGSADRAALKLTRFAVSGMVPVVGGILSDATESVLVGAGLLRNSIGIYGTLLILSSCVHPFLRLGVRYLLYKCAAILSSLLSRSPVSKLIAQIGTAFGMVLAMTGAGATVTLISVMTTLMAAVN